MDEKHYDVCTVCGAHIGHAGRFLPHVHRPVTAKQSAEGRKHRRAMRTYAAMEVIRAAKVAEEY
jgi:RNA polymerase-binding transcription factor DksA